MKSKFSVSSLFLLLLLLGQTAFPTESAAAIEELRSRGPEGLNELRMRYAAQIQKHIDDPTLKPDAEWLRITKMLDTVSGQKNSYLSGLYWYTDLKEAQKVSQQSGKPILSLRLLGKLTDELSCANSRFFRTVLYANAEVSSVLRDRFVLHWQSVRPAPVVTIDFGDGRKLERTLTGNSIHYVLDSSGQPIEAYPGLYGPKAFLRGLTEAEGLFKTLIRNKSEARGTILATHYQVRTNYISTSWLNDTAAVGGKLPAGFTVQRGPNGELTAIRIAALAATKALTEVRILGAMSPTVEALGRITDEPTWRKIAQRHSSDALLDSRSIGLIKRQNLLLSDKEFAALVKNFQESIALDTVRNEYLMHAKLYAWLWTDPARTDLEKFNEKVYAELFLTPRSDQWLGLLEKDVYLGIDNGGINNN